MMSRGLRNYFDSIPLERDFHSPIADKEFYFHSNFDTSFQLKLHNASLNFPQ